MRSADQIFAGQTDEIILVVVGETKHFVRHDVADVDDEVPLLFHQHAIECDWHCPIGGAFADLIDVTCRESRRRARSRRANRERECARWESSQTSAGSLPAYGARVGQE